MKLQGKGRISVLLTTEGTYPFHQGGVSTWADQLVKHLTSIDFVVFGISMDPFVTQKFNLGRTTRLIRVPLWGTEEPSEHMDTPFSRNYLSKLRTTKIVVQERFLPLFRELIREIIAVHKDPQQFGKTIVELYKYFREYDYKVSFKSPLTWEAYKQAILEAVAEPNQKWDPPDVYCLIQSLGWVYRFFNIINTPIPKTTLSHSSAAAFCGLPCVISKSLYGTPFLLTEHGIYLREQYLSLSRRGYPSFLNTFLIRLIQSIVSVNYAFADQISPVCAYNTRWEKQFTTRPNRIEVIYNGVEDQVFMDVKDVVHDRPTVVTVARIDPIKDITTLLEAAALVKQEVANVRFLIYGSVSVPEYYEQCLKLREDLGLVEVVEFVGHINNMPQAYESGDVVAQSSISEAFPYSVIEAMMSGKAVVSTDVGGIGEALEGVGILVPVQSPKALARGITQLLEDPLLRQSLASEARERALSLFTLQESLAHYFKTYVKLAARPNAVKRRSIKSAQVNSVAKSVLRQRLYAERGYALLDNGNPFLAVEQFRKAIDSLPQSKVVPVLVLEIANLYATRGEQKAAENELQKYRLLTQTRVG